MTRTGRALVAEVTDRRRHRLGEVVRAMPEGTRRELVDALTAFAAAADEPVVDEASTLGWGDPLR